jgi:hypothetical protein
MRGSRISARLKQALAFGFDWVYLVPVFNGSGSPGMAGRNTDATWRSLSTLCRELDWSRPRLLHELRNGLPYRTVPPGHMVDWHNLDVECSLDEKTSTVKLVLRVLGTNAGLGLDILTVGIEGMLPTHAEVPLPAAPAEAQPKPNSASAQWAAEATRKLRADGKIPVRYEEGGARPPA